MSGSTTLWRTRGGIALATTFALLVAVTAGGLVALWPRGEPPRLASGAVAPTVGGHVMAQEHEDCGGPVAQRCATLVLRLRDGAHAGRTIRLMLGPTEFAPRIEAGQDVRVRRQPAAEGATLDERYAYVGVDRQAPILWLAVAVTVCAVLLLRWRGLFAIAGLVVSGLLVTRFLLPAVVQGGPAVLIALTAALAVTLVTVTLTSGIGVQTMAATVGIVVTLALATGLAILVADLAALDGRSREFSAELLQAESGLSLRAIVISGAVLGALGALTDTAVTQASAVMALRRANPALGARRLYREGFAIGRDHLAATVHTLVLAYVGAGLALLLALSAWNVTLADAMSSEEVAGPVTATLVGTLALIVCVPVTTGLAAALAVRLPADALPAEPGHVH
jgi:uncharacterized membrane protein